ncbi:MAG: prepilin-type N-terminal cleavage/methylation domain-containing protein [Candidatus Methylophosphatis roskildensis]
MPNRQAGFTLVEIAIVLVIIGLLLGGVLKGQELINSAKVKNFAQDFRSVPLFIYGYQDKFKALPGDDLRADTHVGGILATNGTRGNGVIEGSWDSTTVTHETVLFWQHVRLANLASGSTDFTSTANASLPTNADGGRIGVQSGTPPITGMTGSYFVCSAGIQGKYAKQLDTTMDDGDTANGSMRVGTSGSSPMAAVATTGAGGIVDGNTYTVCLAF